MLIELALYGLDGNTAIQKDAMLLFNQYADRLDDTIMGVVKNLTRTMNVNVDWVDPRAAFAGHGVLCIDDEAHSTSDPWINGVIIDGHFLLPHLANPSPFTFHPNAIGQAHFATLMEAKM